MLHGGACATLSLMMKAFLPPLVMLLLLPTFSCSGDETAPATTGPAGAAGSTSQAAGAAGSTSTVTVPAGGSGGSGGGASGTAGTAGTGGKAPRDVIKVLAGDEKCAACLRTMKTSVANDQGAIDCSQAVRRCEDKPNDCDDTLRCIDSRELKDVVAGVVVKIPLGSHACAQRSCGQRFLRGEPVAHDVLVCMANACQEACGLSPKDLAKTPDPLRCVQLL